MIGAPMFLIPIQHTLQYTDLFSKGLKGTFAALPQWSHMISSGRNVCCGGGGGVSVGC